MVGACWRLGASLYKAPLLGLVFYISTKYPIGQRAAVRQQCSRYHGHKFRGARPYAHFVSDKVS